MAAGMPTAMPEARCLGGEAGLCTYMFYACLSSSTGQSGLLLTFALQCTSAAEVARTEKAEWTQC